MLNCLELTKQYKSVLALNRFTCEFHQGVYGILGPNGAGKSTLMKLISTQLSPTSGSILWEGERIDRLGARYRALLGVQPQSPPMYPWMSGFEFLSYMACAKGIPAGAEREEIMRAAQAVDLAPKLKEPIKSYSGGMRQRMGIAQALLGAPAILLFDEPTAGLDPKQRARIKSLLAQLGQSCVVLLCTHIVSDLTGLAHQILVLQDGRLEAMDTPENLLEPLRGTVWWKPSSDLERDLLNHPGATSMMMDGKDGIRLLADKCPDDGGVAVAPSLEDLYLHYFKEASIA